MRRFSSALTVVLGVCLFAMPVWGKDKGSPPPALSEAELDSLMAQGNRQLEAKSYGEAVATLERLAEARSDDVQIQTNLGYAYLGAEDYKSAEATFKAAKKLDKSYVPAYVGLGLTYVEGPSVGLQALYHFRKAVGEAKRAVKLDPEYADAYRLLGELYVRFREDYKKAIKYYVKYAELKPDDA